MIPPIYILVTVAFPISGRWARHFSVVSAAGGLGAAAGPLIGGVVPSAVSWRASFGLKVLAAYLQFSHRYDPSLNQIAPLSRQNCQPRRSEAEPLW